MPATRSAPEKYPSTTGEAPGTCASGAGGCGRAELMTSGSTGGRCLHRFPVRTESPLDACTSDETCDRATSHVGTATRDVIRRSGMGKPRRRQAGEGGINEYMTKAGPRFWINYPVLREGGTKRVVLKRGFLTRRAAADQLRIELRDAETGVRVEPSKQRLDAYSGRVARHPAAKRIDARLLPEEHPAAHRPAPRRDPADPAHRHNGRRVDAHARSRCRARARRPGRPASPSGALLPPVRRAARAGTREPRGGGAAEDPAARPAPHPRDAPARRPASR